MTATYVRTKGGDRVHLPSCRHLTAAHPEPWNWAAGMTPAEIAAHPVAGMVRPCRFCLPDWPRISELDRRAQQRAPEEAR